MTYAALLVLVALIEYLFFSMMTGKARVDGNITAPAVTGDEHFERMFRVQQNTLESLVVFIPAIFIFAYYWHGVWPGRIVLGLGVIFIIGRFLYYRSYVAEPSSRGPGFIMTFLPNVILCLGGLIGVTRNLIA